ncbi:MAG: hypothetical protein A2840_01915 [Candidatus Buchananbacteria bacterium RIFCSPHIGHO2_01_FULL_47_11b]|uniref:DUF2752 domain-containing protein n=1 Tax=Candidatus Buchananbacteria bacterium RIFCSPHIGHO2_01_FULL_47_11b TaxID=1797537 RepID=A0A1G1Y6U6_9BACT|nr:MAG: hypothetical protein A2840_01915 [Candidatus Buchananbacteria bacterium RIFCSPHIGHO2_01_FULL_47_11b]
MKRTISFLSLLALLTVGVFGFLAIGHDGPVCIVQMATGGVCPEYPISESIFYVGVFKSFSTGVFQIFLALLVCLTVVVLFLKTEINSEKKYIQLRDRSVSHQPQLISLLQTLRQYLVYCRQLSAPQA